MRGINHYLWIILLSGTMVQMVGQSYRKELKSWDQQRVEYLTKPDGWTTLVGLYWLDQPTSTFGSGNQVDVQFPIDFPNTMGEFIVTQDSVLMTITNSKQQVKVNGKKSRQCKLESDLTGNTTNVEWKSFRWNLIQRGQKLGIRLRDTMSDARFELKNIPRYKARKAWKKYAKLLVPQSTETVLITNVMGQRLPTPIVGRAVFEHQGESISLIALSGGPDQLFIIFGDQTNGTETYGGGRFLDVPYSGEGNIIIDFNKAYNPPCVYTDFATCPLPPRENILSFRVGAGEKISKEKR